MPGPPEAKRNKNRQRIIRQAELREMRVACQAANRTIRAWLYLRDRIRQKLLAGATVEEGKLTPHVDATLEKPTDAELLDAIEEAQSEAAKAG